jgi:hypothetical protein
MGQTEAVVILFVLLIAASGCISDGKTVIKANVLVAENDDGDPEIVSIDVSTETASVLLLVTQVPVNTSWYPNSRRCQMMETVSM